MEEIAEKLEKSCLLKPSSFKIMSNFTIQSDGKYLYILQNGELKLFNKWVEQDIIDKLPKNNFIFNRYPSEIYHSDLWWNKNVEYAGEILINKWIITKVNNESWHYLPWKDGNSKVIQTIKNLWYSKEIPFTFNSNTK